MTVNYHNYDDFIITIMFLLLHDLSFVVISFHMFDYHLWNLYGIILIHI